MASTHRAHLLRRATEELPANGRGGSALFSRPVMIKLSKHTADEMERRGILFSYIEAALALPDRLAPDATDPTLSRSYKIIPEFGNRVLRVVHRPDGDDIFVATAHWDRGAKL